MLSLIILFTASCSNNKTTDEQIKKSQTERETTSNKVEKTKKVDSIDLTIDENTTDNLCQVANYLNDNDFSGDFYIYNRKIKWGMYVDSIRIPMQIIDILDKEKIEYVARARGIYQFGFYPKDGNDIGLILNSEATNPSNTAGRKAKYTKLTNKKCLNFNWYLTVSKY